MLQTCSKGLCCRVLHFTVPLPPLELLLDFFGLLCVALCYAILYCDILKCINRAVKYLPCLVSLSVRQRTCLPGKISCSLRF